MKLAVRYPMKTQLPLRAAVVAAGVCLTAAAMAAGITIGPSAATSTTQVAAPAPATIVTSASTTAFASTFFAPAASSSTAVELASIPSNFDVASELVPSWGSGAIPPSAAPDVVGAFRFICNPGQLSADDPIVYPGQPGRAHLHQFFGNTKADANSTYASLRTTGESTCNSPLNRSAYWLPAMMNGRGRVVRPDYISVYYKRRPSTDPLCDPTKSSRALGQCVDLPRGLRFVFGYDMTNMGGPATGAGYFNCDGPGAVSGHFPNIVVAAKGCPAGARLGAVISAPECWDGKNLDSADHRSHVAYPSYGSWGYLRCPTTHPKVIPGFTMGVWYSVDTDLDRSGTWSPSRPTWHLSSDVMPGMPMMTPGSSFHADWFGAWDDGVLRAWTVHCINKMLNCSGGDLGDGRQLKMYAGFKWNAEPRVVDVPTTAPVKVEPVVAAKPSVCGPSKQIASKYLDKICGRS